MKPIRVALVDDHALVREGIRALLERIEGVTVVGEAEDGLGAIELVRARHPDIVVIDISLPGLNGLDAAARLLKEEEGIRVIVLSMLGNELYVDRALQVGVHGYLLKNSDVAELGRAIRAVIEGNVYFSPHVARFVAELARRGGARDADRLLSQRQREVLQLIAEGHTTKEIATRLGLSVKTVDTHRMQLMRRLNIHDIAGLVRYAIRTGVTSADR